MMDTERETKNIRGEREREKTILGSEAIGLEV